MLFLLTHHIQNEVCALTVFTFEQKCRKVLKYVDESQMYESAFECIQI